MPGPTPCGGEANVVRAAQRTGDDHLAGIALHKIVTNRANSRQMRHACLHDKESDDGSCACCFAGGARAPMHQRDPSRVRSATTWHADVIGPTRERGLGLDAVGNLKYGSHAALYTNDVHREVIFPVLRSTTKALETEGDLTLLRARTRETILAVSALRHDRGPEFVGARTVMQRVEIVPIPSVDHGATSEATNLKVQVGTRRTRMHSGMPEILWPLVLDA